MMWKISTFLAFSVSPSLYSQDQWRSRSFVGKILWAGITQAVFDKKKAQNESKKI